MCRAPFVHSAPVSVNRRRLWFSGVAGETEMLTVPPPGVLNATSRLLPSGELSALSMEYPAGRAGRGSRRPRDEKDAPTSPGDPPVRLLAAKDVVLPLQEG